MTIDPDAGLPPEQRWTWDHPVGPRWLLSGEVGFDDSHDDLPLALCADVEGVFVDLPPRPRERFTLVGCTPAGALADLLDRLPADALGTERAWLGNVSLTSPATPTGTSSTWWEHLDDVVVLAQRPSATTPGTVDVDLDGFVHLNDRTDAVARPRGIDEFVLLCEDEVAGSTCEDVEGVFREQAAPPVPRVRLLGCRPEPALLVALDAVGQSTNAALRRRWVRARVDMVADDGSAVHVTGALLAGTVNAAEPSPLGAGLLDVTVEIGPREPLPAGVLDVLEHWRAGRPSRRNLWARHDRELRHWWAGVALGCASGAPDRPPSTTYELDGRFVTDVEGFYCAIGEAVNGPGGYFGWNLHALHDCLGGGFRRTNPVPTGVARLGRRARTPRRRPRPASVGARDHLGAPPGRARGAPGRGRPALSRASTRPPASCSRRRPHRDPTSGSAFNGTFHRFGRPISPMNGRCRGHRGVLARSVLCTV